MNRREFVRRTGLLAGTVLGAGALGQFAEAGPAADLGRRTLGKTGVSLTTLTLGTAPCGFALPHDPKNVADCVNAAIDLGVNAIDTAPAYDVGEEGVGLGLGSRRKSVFLSTKVLADSVDKAEQILANSLKTLKTDYIDLLYFHQVGERKGDLALKADGVFTWLVKQKKAGKARFVGITGHNRPANFLRYLESGECDALLTVVNFVDRYTYNFEENVLPAARKNHVGIVAMKVFGGAKNMQYGNAKLGSQLDRQFYELATRYSLGVPGVSTLNIGAANPGQVRQNVATVAGYKPLTDEEKTRLEVLGKQLAPEWGKHFGPLT